MAFPATLSLISNVFTERRERARAIGLWGAIAGVAIATGPIVGGWLLERYSWAAIFIAMAPVAAVAAILVALAVPTSKDPDAAAVDIPGLVLSSATMALLVFTIIEAPTYGWGAARSVAGFAGSAVLLAAFIVRERRAAHPMLDVRLFRNMRFSAASGAVTVSFFTLFGFIFLITQYFQFVRGYGPLSTGVRLLPVAVSVGAGSVAGTQLAVRAGTKLVVTAGLVAMAGFYGWVAATSSATLAYGIIAAQMVVYGLGLGLTSAPATESIMGAIPRTKAGVGSAVNDSTRLIGGTLGVAVLGSVYASVYASRLAATMPAAVPAPAAAIAHQSVGAAYVVADKIAALGHPALGLALHHASTNAFLRGLTISALVAGSIAALGAVLAVLFLPAQPASLTAYQAEPTQTDPHTPDRATPPRQSPSGPSDADDHRRADWSL
jgi:predicted MFS family arabinose efflux permease